MTKLTLCFLLLSTLVWSQINPKTRWGNVSDEEFAFKEVSFEADADAVILWEEGYMNLKYPMETTLYRRIKVLTDKGKSYANQRIVFQHFDKLEAISNIKAQTINQVNGKAETYSVKRSEIHFNKINEYFTEVVFTFPNVQVGSIIEFEYVSNRRNMSWIEAWQFQHEIPTMYSQISVNPESSLAGFSAIALGENLAKNPKKESTGGNVSIYKLTNLPSYLSNDFVYNPESHADRLLLQLKSYYDYKDTYSGDQMVLKETKLKWEDLSRDIYHRHNTFMGPVLAKDILKTIPQGSSQKEYLQNIVNYFKVNYKWNGINQISGVPAKVNRDIHNAQTGSNADLNSWLYTILIEAGFQNEYVVFSSRNHGQIITSYPYIGQFNSSLNFVTLENGETILLDASDLSNDLGFMPLKNYNHLGLVINAKEEKFININPPLTEVYIAQNYNFTNDKVNFSFNEKSKGYPNSFNQNLYKSPQIIDISFDEKSKEISKLGEEDYWISRKTYQADFEGKNIYTISNPFLGWLKTYNFRNQKRTLPVELDFPYVYKVQSTIKIPNGYKAEIPANFNVMNSDKDKNLMYSQKAVVKDETLTIIYELMVKKNVFTNQYQEVKNFFTQANTSATQTIFLKKN